MFNRQPRSPAMRCVAPDAFTCCVFSETIAPEISPYLVANKPPKPQQTSLSFISMSSSPSTLASSWRGPERMPSSRRPEQES